MIPRIRSALLSGFMAIREKVARCTNDAERVKLIMAVCDDVTQDADVSIRGNLRNIVHHFHCLGALRMDDLIQYLQKEGDLDSETMRREEEDGFDEKFGTVTSPILAQYELPEQISLERLKTSGRYHPSPIASVRTALQALTKYSVRYEDFTFIDIGSGLGRNLLLAAEYPFRDIIGIEHSAYLHELAESNVSAYAAGGKKCDKIRLVCGDALQFNLPSGNLVLYFWRPFTEEMANIFFNRVEAGLAQGRGRVILVFLGLVYSIVNRSTVFQLLDVFQTGDILFKDKAHFYISIYGN